MVVLPDGTFKGTIGECKFLTWDGDKAVCKVHGKKAHLEFEGEKITVDWEKTPCGEFGQIESSPDDECRMGRWMRDHGQTAKSMMEARNARNEG